MRDENDSTMKKKPDIVPLYMKNNPEDLDSSKIVPEHEE